MSASLLTLDPATYDRHSLHSQERNWAETNCYVDVWIELLHAWGYEPIAALPFTVGIDFEGDQFTFFKFPHDDLRRLFGLETHELAVWRPLTAHLQELIAIGRPVLVELDSYYLPDTAGTSYRREHVKSTVAAVDIDIDEQTLGYFHGQSYYRLSGDDYAGVFRLNSSDVTHLPPYVEFVKRRASWLPTEAQCLRQSLDLLAEHVQRLPDENPFEKFKHRFARDLEWLIGSSLEMLHQYSFATWRQFGSCYELSATYFRWLDAHGIGQLENLIEGFTALSTGGKTLQFQLARAMSRKKKCEPAALDELAATWQSVTDSLRRRWA